MNVLADAAALPLYNWENFYVIVGSSGGALIGLQFVVIALLANLRAKADGETIGAFGTPTVVHFGGVLGISAMMAAPWATLQWPGALLVIYGGVGLLYCLHVCQRTRRQQGYKPVLEDWFWYAVAPCGIYLTLVIAGGVLARGSQRGLFAVATAAVCLLFVGIHNSWDSVTHILVSDRGKDQKPG